MQTPLNTEVDFPPDMPVEAVEATASDKPLLEQEQRAFSNKDYDLDQQEQKQKIDLRGIVAYWVLGLVSAWMLFLMVLISTQAANCSHLSDAVILGLIGGTTVNIIGVCIWVVRSLFPSKEASV